MDDDKLTPAEIQELGRDFVMVSWGLLGEWWCIPADATPEEQAAMVAQIKENMGADFVKCPDEWIADRLYGGFGCQAPGRRHVHFASGQYSFIAAGEGGYWENDAEHRAEHWARLIEENGDQAPPLDGPFTVDAPKAVLAVVEEQ